MSFYGRAFVFDGTPCELYDLMLYDIDNQDEEIAIGGSVSITEETVGEKWRPYFYGARIDGKLEFDMTFGVNERRLDAGKYLDRWEIAEVSSWLIGHKGYKWLYIDQPDMTLVGYRCILSDLQAVPYGSVPWALKVHVTCDGPFAYLERKDMVYTVNGALNIQIYNESSLNDWYYPKLTFERTSGTAFSVKNEADGGRGVELQNIPASVVHITIDGEHGVIRNDQDLNLYAGFNFQFLRLARGYNPITITGNGTLTISCEYPINVGG